MNIRSISKKLIICLMVFLLLFNFLISSVDNRNVVLAATNEEIAQDAEEEADSLFGGCLNGLAGILTWIPKALMNICSMLLGTLSYFIIDTAGHGDNEVSVFLTPFDIFFNKFTLTNINIFQTEDIESTSGGDLVYSLRETASMLYYIIRAVAVGILLVMLLIIGIKMAIASLAEEKAKLKNMFFDWLVSAALVFLLHMIIFLIIRVNEGLVGLIENIANGANITEMVDSLRSAAFSVNFLLGWGSTIAYAILTVQTMVFAVIYIVRLFKVLFLIVIAPIMPLTYSLDRAKGGQAQALNGWLREFSYNVFIQVLHCIIYVVIVSVPLSAIDTVTIGSISSLTQPLLLVIALMFVKKAEELLKSLFGFDNAKSLTSFSSVVNNSQRAILSGISIANGTYTVTNNTSNNTTTFGSNIQTLGERASNKVHEYRDRAATWLSNQEQVIGGAAPATAGTSGDSSTGEQAETEDDNIIDAEYREVDDGDNNQNGAVPIFLGTGVMSDEDAERVADAVSSNTNDEENSENKTENINVIEDNTEIEDIDSEGKEEKRPLTDEERREREELKELYQRMIDELEQANETQKEIQTRLQDLADKLDEDKVAELTDQIQEIFDREGLEAANRYAETLGQTAEGAFAREYVNLLNNRRDLLQLLDAGEGKLINMINDSVEEGIIDNNQGINLYNNAIRVATGEEDKTDEILGLDEDNRESSNSNIEVVEGEVVDITKDLGISKSALNSVLQSTRRATINNSKILQEIDGDITVEGDFTDANILNFNTRVLEKARAGAYSESNFRKAEEAVKREGEIAVRRLEKFREDQSEANARMLTPAGKKYAELMVEAQQASMFIVSAGVAERNTSTEYASQSTSVRNQTINIARNPEAPSNRSNNVLNDLNQRKKYA